MRFSFNVSPLKIGGCFFCLALRLFFSDVLFKEKFDKVYVYMNLYIFSNTYILCIYIYICLYAQKIAKFSHISLRMSDFSTRCRALGVEDLVNIL